MKQSTALSCCKKIVLVAAALFSVTAFATTCPEIKEFKSSDTGMQWITDSGWVSTSPPTSDHPVPSKFIQAKIVDPAKNQAGDYVGNMVCRYESVTTSAPIVAKSYITMEWPGSIATTVESQESRRRYYTGWFYGIERNEGFDRYKPEGPDNQLFFRNVLCSTDIASCEFDLAHKVVNPF